MKRVAWLSLLIVVLALGFGSRLALGGQTCVGYRVTAPIVGTRSGKPCLPNPFNNTFTLHHCEAVPPLGVSACATVFIDTP